MNLSSPLGILALAVALSAPAFAQDTTKERGDQNDQPGTQQQQPASSDPSQPDQPRSQSQSNQPGAQPQPGEPATQSQNQPGAGQPGTDTTMSKRERDYQAALKKCEGMEGAAHQQCVDKAKKKFGQM